MSFKNKPAPPASGQPDPVARRISSDIDGSRIDPAPDGENDAIINADQALNRSNDSASHVDLAAGGEFIQMRPNESAAGTQRGADTSDALTAEERAAEPPAGDADDQVDEASMDSFPASDPPSFTPTRAGGRSHDPVDRKQ